MTFYDQHFRLEESSLIAEITDNSKENIGTLLIRDPRNRQNPLRQQLWRAGHAHADVLVILSLVALLDVDQTDLSEGWKQKEKIMWRSYG